MSTVDAARRAHSGYGVSGQADDPSGEPRTTGSITRLRGGIPRPACRHTRRCHNKEKGYFTDYYPEVDGYVALRYSRNMTIPGKGGRPRKWRSDADRVRAFRARQRGEDEPATVAVALEQGDEAATAWERVQELGETIEALRVELKTSRTALRHAEKALDQERARFIWIEEDGNRLQADLNATRQDRDVLQERYDDLLRPTPAAPTRPQAASGPNRAQRREAERKRRRPT